MKKPVVEDSLEKHIQLCAEGARQKPNLSGKRTETQDANIYAGSPCAGCFLFLLDYREFERGN